jgi:hypothetical protein
MRQVTGHCRDLDRRTEIRGISELVSQFSCVIRFPNGNMTPNYFRNPEIEAVSCSSASR